MLSQGLLMIDNDRERGILSIKLLCDPKILSAEQKTEFEKFISAILRELSEFKAENNISADCAVLQKDRDQNILSLQVRLSKPSLYDAFIRRLAGRQLLPLQNIKQDGKRKVEYPRGMNHFSGQLIQSFQPTNPTSYVESKKESRVKNPFILRPRTPLSI
jgi:hypothetical protein